VGFHERVVERAEKVRSEDSSSNPLIMFFPRAIFGGGCAGDMPELNNGTSQKFAIVRGKCRGLAGGVTKKGSLHNKTCPLRGKNMAKECNCLACSHVLLDCRQAHPLAEIERTLSARSCFRGTG